MKTCKICEIKPAALGRSICNTCKSRNYIKQNRPNMIWHWIKKSAKKRGILFDLPKQYLFDLLIQSGYVENSGLQAHSLTVDRINPELGYTIGNIQIITKSENSSKYHQVEKDLPF